ncbi:MAG: GTPase HflX [Pseudomonadota bacterium]
MKTLVIYPYLKRQKNLERTPEARLAEAVRLTQAISLDIQDEMILPLSEIRPSSLIGQGKIEQLKEIIEEKEIGLVVADCKLSPIQQRNLEKGFGCKVIDRTALILEIFGARARTYEGKLQVEMAALNYQKSRLVRSWTHLERQRGGFGFLGGPGESQIEIDRRLIRDRIAKISRELEEVKRTRELHRKNRRLTPFPVIALVGYTNAGKSTLFNRLTKADVLAMDKLFATLDPTMRRIKLPSGSDIMLSDTVGFISELPHELVAAFRATLEEVQEADLLLHIRDISHPDSAEQKQDVLKVLESLIDSDAINNRVIEVWNKVDQLEEKPEGNIVAISALTGEGIAELLSRIDEKFNESFLTKIEVSLPASEGEKLAWLYGHGNVLSIVENDDFINVTANLSKDNLARWKKMKGII